MRPAPGQRRHERDRAAFEHGTFGRPPDSAAMLARFGQISAELSAVAEAARQRIAAIADDEEDELTAPA